MNLAELKFQEHSHESASAFKNVFSMNNKIHQYPTRQTNLYHFSRTCTALTQDTFIFTAQKSWNPLPKTYILRDTKNFCTFKCKLKNWLLELYRR